jgi:hypothetical protein
VKTSSRIDPVGVEIKAGPIYESADALGWTLDERDAVKEKGKAKLYARGGDRPGRPSLLNHGNVTPSIDSRAGGITASEIVGTTVFSFIQLRRLRFPTLLEEPVSSRPSKSIATRRLSWWPRLPAGPQHCNSAGAPAKCCCGRATGSSS